MAWTTQTARDSANSRPFAAPLLVIGALLLCVLAAGVAETDIAALGELSGLEWAGVVLATGGVFASVLALPPCGDDAAHPALVLRVRRLDRGSALRRRAP